MAGSRLLLLGIAVVTAAAAAGAAAAPARDALVRPGTGIGRIDLGMTYAQVVRVLGRPDAVNKRQRTTFGLYVEYGWNLADWTVALQGRRSDLRVVKVATGLRRDRTRRGVGVGSTQRQVTTRERARCGYPARTNRIVNGGFCLAGRTPNEIVFALNGECALPPGTYRACTRFRIVVYEVIVASPMLLQELRFKRP